MSKLLLRYRGWVGFFILLMVAVGGWMVLAFQTESQTLHATHYQKQANQIQDRVALLLSEQKTAALGLALMLSENPAIKSVLQSPCCEQRAGLSRIAQNLMRRSPIKDVWLHVINAQGVSYERSWTDRRGDSLLGVREDLTALIANPLREPLTSISTGLFTTSFKTIIAIFDDARLLGFVEVILPFQPLIDRFDGGMTESLVFSDKRLRDRLVLGRSERFIDDYYLVNTRDNPQLLARVSAKGLGYFFDGAPYHVEAGYLWVPVAIFNAQHQIEAHWLVAMPLDALSMDAVDILLGRYVWVSVVVLVMLALLGWVFLSRQQVLLQRHYYRDVLDSASDIVYVTDLKRITDANAHFFELFSEFKTLAQFHRHYRCMCDTFEAEDGFLQAEINGVYWIEHILNHPGEVHKAKIIRQDKTYYFAIKIQPLTEDFFGQYTVVMQDISELEAIQRKLTHLSQTDELTGIGNRLFFNQRLHQEFLRAQRYQIPLCILMFDVDFFKQINDTHGHDKGDVVLHELAQLINNALREGDLFSRYGGEEFIVMLLDTDMAVANKVAERLLHLVSHHSFADLAAGEVTCSFGLTALHEDDSENALLKRLDNALYQAKHQGRNRIVVAQ
ncbi:MAG: GGDEF domain-containing protein [Thiomicrospira sp.]|jgi:diguanylate cyclase (GGDEF)-like protein|nr:GGDEF domain-containing protein [Thiomicrospira sp.]